MPVLALHFPWRRYHATPWGRYVNEGAVELPPSPWRLLRALYSVWQLRAPDLDEQTVHGLLEQLAVPPTYVLPPYQLSHTRHYFPDSKHRSSAPSTDLALDAFAVLGGDATLYAIWPGELTEAQDKALDRLATSLPYLGRADSLCDARVERGWEPSIAKDRLAVPLDLDGEPPAGLLHADLLAPQLPLDITALIQRPVEVRAAKLVYPPGSRLVPYALPGPERAQPRRRAKTKRDAGTVTAVRLSVQGTPQPRSIDTVTVTDALRAACVKALSKIRDDSPAASRLAGKTADGHPLEGHQHTHYLALEQNGQINELALWVPGGLCEDELAALDRLAGRTIGTPADVPRPKNLHVRVSAYGDRNLLPRSMIGPARSWMSRTPFVPSRYPLRRYTSDEYLRIEITRELGHRNLPEPARVTRLDGNQWALYTRHRWSPHQRPGGDRKRVGSRTENRPAFGVRIEFADPVDGPVTLGTLSHFGLGLFVDETT